MSAGRVCQVLDLAEGFPDLDLAMAARSAMSNSPLLLVVEKWLRADQIEARKTTRTNHLGETMTRWDVLSDRKSVV